MILETALGSDGLPHVVTPHAWCTAPGRYSCSYDEQIDDMLLDGVVESFGAADTPTGWWAPGIELDDDQAVHYGGRWAIARVDNSGFFQVDVYAERAEHDVAHDALLADWSAWLGDDA